MNHKIRFVTTLIVLTIGFTACAGLSDEIMSIGNVPSLEQASDADVQQPPSQAQGTDGQDPQEQPSQGQSQSGSYSYPNLDSGQVTCYDDRNAIPCPEQGEAFYGQDAQYASSQLSYIDNGDGTITDLNTGLMWIQDPGDKMLYYDAIASADSFSFAGYDDWRVPTIKELYSLMDFSGIDDAVTGTDPFVDTDYFVFEYGDPSIGEREIDSQWVTTSIYEASVMGGQECFFGVNFADGRIKCYPTGGRMNKTYFLRLVRGGEGYGENEFVDNGDGTISDLSTGLVWQQADSGEGMDWGNALNYCESLELAGQGDWRLPNAKELQYIVDYSRSPDTTDSAAIDSIFSVGEILNEAGQKDYPFYWTSTTHASAHGGQSAVYIAFGRALGYMNNQWMDVHGAGAQRSDPKSGDPADYPSYFGPQGDVSRLLNYVRCVRGSVSDETITGGSVDNTPLTQGQPPSGQAPNGQAPQGQSPQQGGGQPPQEAINACLALSQGAVCTVDTPNGSLTGSCLTVQSGQLACVPAGGPPGDGPPQ